MGLRTWKVVGRRVVLVVVLELLWGHGLAKVEGESVEDVLLGVGEGRVLRDRRARELGVADRCCHGFSVGCVWSAAAGCWR